MNQQKTLQDQIQKTMGMTPLGTMQGIAQKNMEAWGQLQKSFLDMLTPRGGVGGSGATDPSSAHQSSAHQSSAQKGDDTTKD